MTGSINRSSTGTRLIGRASECQALDDLLDSARGGRSNALVLVGAPGIGKSALIGYALDRAASAVRVLRVSGNQAERELAFAGLHQLIGTAVESVDRLPAPQRAALRVVFGLDEGSAPDLLMIALGVLGLIAELSTERPLLCLVDDAQWLDSASVQVLSFVARRLAAEPVGILFAAREIGPELSGLPTLTVPGLAPRHARTLLDSALRAPLDEDVRRQIVSETAGNSLALLELPRGATPTELAGGFALPGVAPLSERIEASYRRRMSELSWEAQQFLLLAAADPVGDPTLLWAAAAHISLGAAAAVPAVDAELLEFGTRVRFPHPLARSAIYRSADPGARRDVHRALEAVTDAQQDPDRRAWHRAQAAVGPDEETARQLEESARRARARGGIAAAAAFLERAAMLTPVPEARTRRLIAAAGLTQEAGELDRALRLLDAADVVSLTGEQAARVTLARGHIAIGQHRGRDAVELLVDAARDLKQQGLPEAHATVLDAILVAIWVTATPEHIDLARSAAVVLEDGGELSADSATDLLIRGLVRRVAEGPAVAAPAFRRAVDLLVAESAAPGPSSATLVTLWGRVNVTIEMWDATAWGLIGTREAVAARRDGALANLNGALCFLACHQMFLGEFQAAESALDEGRSIALATGGAPYRQVEMLLHGWRGDEAGVRRLGEEGGEPSSTGLGTLDEVVADWSRAILYNSLGRFDSAHAAASRLFQVEHFPAASLVVSELAEAASRIGDARDLAAALAWVERSACVTPTPWCLGIVERLRALAGHGDDVRRHYTRSIEHLGQIGARTEVARSHLLYGEWLRRHGRGRAEARHHLQVASGMFERMGANGFAARAAQELRAMGDQPDEGRPEGSLTAQELRVAGLASAGLTNPEIASQLYLSPRTIQYHLGKVFTKLGVKSRVELSRALDRGDGS